MHRAQAAGRASGGERGREGRGLSRVSQGEGGIAQMSRALGMSGWLMSAEVGGRGSELKGVLLVEGREDSTAKCRRT